MRGPATDGVIRDQLSDDTLVVFVSDAHIGGPAGSDIFESAAELTALLRDLSRHQGPVELVLAGDFFDLLRMGDPGRGEDGVTATIAGRTTKSYLPRCGPLRQPLGVRWCTLPATTTPRRGGTPRFSGLSRRRVWSMCSRCRTRPASGRSPSSSSTASMATSSTRRITWSTMPTRWIR